MGPGLGRVSLGRGTCHMMPSPGHSGDTLVCAGQAVVGRGEFQSNLGLTITEAADLEDRFIIMRHSGEMQIWNCFWKTLALRWDAATAMTNCWAYNAQLVTVYRCSASLAKDKPAD